MNNPTTLKFNLRIKNSDATYIIASLATGSNYALDFYFAYADVSGGVITGTTYQAMGNTGTSPVFDFGLAAGASSALLAFQTTATLPTASCSSYAFFCACVSKGTEGLYTDNPANNNCACRQAKTTNLISCTVG
jgi:hypothetical protein